MIDIDEKCLQHIVDVLSGKKVLSKEVMDETIVQLQRKIDSQHNYNMRKILKMGKVGRPSKNKNLDMELTNQ